MSEKCDLECGDHWFHGRKCRHMLPKDERSELLENVKAEMLRRGYRIDVMPDGTEYVVRPDGSVAIIAKPKSPHVATEKKP